MATALPENENIGAVLVCGAGIAGIQASLDLAESGFKVMLLDSKAAIGGRMAQLDKTFPTGDCAMCILSPKLVECARNRNIEILTLADIQSVSGRPGRFKVKIRQNPRYVDIKKCDACGDCNEACPVSLPSEFDCGLGSRKAISRLYPQAIPNVFSIAKASGSTPCKFHCPADVNVQGFMALIAAGKIPEAYELLRRRCTLPAVSGRVCRHFCQDKCHRNEVDEAVSIRNLERFVADFIAANPDQVPPFPVPSNPPDGRVAVIGGGPAGLTAAADLALIGYRVTLFEAKSQLGGMLRYGIPAYRLPKEILDAEIRQLLTLGIEVRTNTSIAKTKDLLLPQSSPGGFNAVFIAAGAWINTKLNIPGEDARGVWPGLDFLGEVNSGSTPKIGPVVLVLGGGDMAVDAARCALRLPGVQSVHLACLENRSEMPANSDAAAEAFKEGIIFHNELGPTRIEAADEQVVSVTFRACTSVFDEYRRYDPLYDDTKISQIFADTVIVAVGRGVDSGRFGMETRPGGRIFADKNNLATSIKGVFAGGDAALGPASVADAIAQGHKGAEAIDAYIRGSAAIRGAENAQPSVLGSSIPKPARVAPNPRPDAPLNYAVPMPKQSVGNRLKDNTEINLGYSRELAIQEAQRCLACGLCSECMQCVKVCSPGAIMHDQKPVEMELEVGSIILAPGMEEFDASLWEEFGFGRHSNVLSGVQFERLLSATGPTGGCLQRPSDGGEVRKLAFIQCVGSRDASRGPGHCSSICCMSAAKEALVALEHARGKQLEISIFCTDVRAFGKEFDNYLQRVGNEPGVKFNRFRPSRVSEVPGWNNLRVSCLDPAGAEQHQEFDLVVLSTGVQISSEAKEMATRLGLELNPYGFAKTHRLTPLETSLPGILVAGVFQEPKDIPESATQGSAAAACAMGQLTSVRSTMTQRREYPWERDIADEPPRIGVFICHCGRNISSIVDVGWVARKAAKMDGVCHAEAAEYTCSDANQQHIKEMIRLHRLNRLVVASCSSRTHEILFQETLRESGLNRHLFAMTDIRDQCSWVHRDDPAAATAKSIDLVSMAVARVRHLKAQPRIELSVQPSALILGGGLGGMTAAQNLAGQGFKVHLIERESSLGGLLRNIHSTLETGDVQSYLQALIGRTLSNPQINVYRNSSLIGISGQAGNFTSLLKVEGREVSVNHGVVIVATGGQERTTEKFFHGRNPHVVTQSRLESILAGGNSIPELDGKPDATVVMIQCVESRDAANPYCSRVCCSEAVKNAIEIKRRLPHARVIILGRDMRTNGLRELFYQKAVELGVEFIRHPENRNPEVVEEKGRFKIRVFDVSKSDDRILDADLMVLSIGIAPAPDNPVISKLLRSALTTDGFFQEAHPKLRPVDLANEGEFICGLAHSPRFMDETIAQAQAAAARAATILSKAQLEITLRIADVHPAVCVACATCVKLCPYGAPMINELRKAEIQGAKCMGCGSCVAACPARAITLQQQESETVAAMLEELLAGGGTV